MPEVNESALEASLEVALGDVKAPAPKTVRAPEVDEAPEEEVVEVEASDDAEESEEEGEEVEAAPVDELELEIEVDGTKEIIRGRDNIKELVQKGKHYSRGSEENARVREILEAQHRTFQEQSKFQQYILGDIQELRQMDSHLEQFSKVDWNAAIDADFTNAMKLQEQRNQLRAARDAKFSELNQKQQQFQQGQAQATQQLASAEQAALFAKAPQLRNPEKWNKAQQEVARGLSDYGFTQAEIGSLMDHRMLLVALDAIEMRQLRQGKSEKVKQARTAPPVVKPGAVTGQAQGKANFQSLLKDVRKAGRQGQHKVQEELAIKAFNRAFK